MSGDRPYLEENPVARERLRDLTARLTDEDLGRAVGHGWTVSSTLCHLAFWDRWTLANLEKWERGGVQIVPTDPDPINDGALPLWLAMPGREAVRQALAAAEAADSKVEQLSRDLAEEIMAKRPRTVIRARHRNEHLDEIERALSRQAP